MKKENEKPPGGGKGEESIMNEQTVYAEPCVPLEEREGYCGILKFILLSIVTLGIYTYIWVYRTTVYLNRYKGEPEQDASAQTLLCIFIPYYLIYWTYTNSRRVDGCARASGIPSDLSTVCLILAFFVPIAACALMQDKLNAVVAAEGTAPTRPASGGAHRWKCPQCATLCADRFCPTCGTAKPSGDGVWICAACATVCTDRFCPTCGAKRPADGWLCTCGTHCTDKFCPTCGKARA